MYLYERNQYKFSVKGRFNWICKLIFVDSNSVYSTLFQEVFTSGYRTFEYNWIDVKTMSLN